MSTHLPGFLSFFRFLHYFVLAKLATTSIRVNRNQPVKESSNKNSRERKLHTSVVYPITVMGKSITFILKCESVVIKN